MPAFLSDEWLDLLRATADAAAVTDEELQLVVQQVIDRGPATEPFEYALRVSGGRLAVERGRAASADLTFTQDEATALAIHRGQLSAQDAFLDGRLRVDAPDPSVLSQIAALTALDDVLAGARA